MLSCSVVSNSLPPLDCSTPDSTVHGISEAKILEWVASLVSPALPADSSPAEPLEKPSLIYI